MYTADGTLASTSDREDSYFLACAADLYPDYLYTDSHGCGSLDPEDNLPVQERSTYHVAWKTCLRAFFLRV